MCLLLQYDPHKRTEQDQVLAFALYNVRCDSFHFLFLASLLCFKSVPLSSATASPVFQCSYPVTSDYSNSIARFVHFAYQPLIAMCVICLHSLSTVHRWSHPSEVHAFVHVASHAPSNHLVAKLCFLSRTCSKQSLYLAPQSHTVSTHHHCPQSPVTTSPQTQSLSPCCTIFFVPVLCPVHGIQTTGRTHDSTTAVPSLPHSPSLHFLL